MIPIVYFTSDRLPPMDRPVTFQEARDAIDRMDPLVTDFCWWGHGVAGRRTLIDEENQWPAS